MLDDGAAAITSGVGIGVGDAATDGEGVGTVVGGVETTGDGMEGTTLGREVGRGDGVGDRQEITPKRLSITIPNPTPAMPMIAGVIFPLMTPFLT